MNMMINILCDANVSCDTLVVKVAQAADLVCQPIIKESETNGNDVLIVSIICLAIAFVAIVAGATVLLWKWLENRANEKERVFKKTKEEKESERKQKSDLLNKLLDFQKEVAFPYEKDKDGKFVKKSFEAKEKSEYLKTLAQILGISLPVE